MNSNTLCETQNNFYAVYGFEVRVFGIAFFFICQCLFFVFISCAFSQSPQINDSEVTLFNIDNYVAGQFEMPLQTLANVRDVCIFFVRDYLRPWFDATQSISAPRHDLRLMKEILLYKDISPRISKVAAGAFKKSSVVSQWRDGGSGVF